jgi:lipopolysaccharide export LptBFGC system permease protein LptF
MANEVQDLSCPQCISGNVRRHHSAKSVAVWVGAVALLFVLVVGASSSYSGASKASPVLAILLFMLFVAGIGAILAPFSLAFGKNRCKDCGHKWR